MFRQKQWLFSGTSGKKYSFELYAKSAPLPTCGGIYLLAYSHPRGHRAGFEVNVLRVGSAENLQAAVAAQWDDLWLQQACWNCVYLLKQEDRRMRSALYEDLQHLLLKEGRL